MYVPKSLLYLTSFTCNVCFVTPPHFDVQFIQWIESYFRYVMCCCSFIPCSYTYIFLYFILLGFPKHFRLVFSQLCIRLVFVFPELIHLVFNLLYIYVCFSQTLSFSV